MAIIKCSECGHDVSDKAAICPHCGYSVSEILKSINQEMESQEPKNECIICGSSFIGDVCPNCGACAVSPVNKSEDQPESTTPGAEKCSRCGKEISDNATFCSNCGASLKSNTESKNEHRKAVEIKVITNECSKCGMRFTGATCPNCGTRNGESKPPEKSIWKMDFEEANRSPKAIAVMCIVCVIAFMTVIIGTSGGSNKNNTNNNNSTKKNTSYSTQSATPDYNSLAKKAAQSLVYENIKSPLTASFSAVEIVEKDSKGRYLVTMAVDAQNSFGAYIRNYWAVVVSDIQTDGHYKYSKNFGANCYSSKDAMSASLELVKSMNNWGK